ncbi:MAG TPA: tRNA (guanosine(46)-N7)-methyltransferase TrmB [Spirochaetia bacterium]|nr:tRNA (guanosine(46)-N7)-methyltransferase TrmB [Spirochaetia bacterium]
MTAPRIRSYVLRQARMSPLQQRSFDTLYDTYSLPLAQRPVDLEDAFSSLRKRLGVQETGKPREVILEIGFGMGSATVEIADADRSRDYFGIEVHTPGVGKVLSEIKRRDLSNLLLIRADAVEVVSGMIPGSSLGGVHIFFPDPWPKKRHHKRRLVQPDFARLVGDKIRENGYLYIVTDWEDYAYAMLELLERIPGIANTSTGFAPPKPWRPRTRFEEKGLERSHPIFELFFRRIAQS